MSPTPTPHKPEDRPPADSPFRKAWDESLKHWHPTDWY